MTDYIKTYHIEAYDGGDVELEELETISEDDLDQRYWDMLNEVYGEFEIGQVTFDAARILKELDPIAYRTGFNDWIDGEDWTETPQHILAALDA